MKQELECVKQEQSVKLKKNFFWKLITAEIKNGVLKVKDKFEEISQKLENNNKGRGGEMRKRLIQEISFFLRSFLRRQDGGNRKDIIK